MSEGSNAFLFYSKNGGMEYMKRGRPTDTGKAKNRRHTLVLTEKAEIILREVIKVRGSMRWLNRYLSEHIINDFGGKKATENILLHKLLETQRERDALNKQCQDIAREIQKMREDRLAAKAKQELRETIRGSRYNVIEEN